MVNLAAIAQKSPAPAKSTIGTEEITYVQWPQGWEITSNPATKTRVDLLFHPPGQSAKAWQEMGMISILKGKASTNLLEFAYDNNSSLMNNCKDHDFEILADGTKEKAPYLIYRFKTGGCGGTDTLANAPLRHWITLAKPGKDHLFLVQYGFKGPELSKQAIATWLARFKAVTMMPLPPGAKHFHE